MSGVIAPGAPLPQATPAKAAERANLGTAPERPARRGRLLAWTVIVIVLVLVASIGVLVQSSLKTPDTAMLDPEGVGPGGAQALARVLEAEGVDIVVVRDQASAKLALADGATLVLGEGAYLSDDALLEVVDASASAVVISVPTRVPPLLIKGTKASGFNNDGAVAPACDLPAAQNAGPVIPGRTFEIDHAAREAGAAGCYPVDGLFGLVTGTTEAGTPVTFIDATALFSNQHILEQGNAALALGLLGTGEPLVWFVPSIDDSDVGTVAPTLGELTPGWVSPAIVLLLCAGLAAGLWRGRRFGPLVAERLPVTVRASETTEGRARLYARTRDAVHAADQLRIGTLERLARMLGLGPAAAAGEISDAAAARVGAEPKLIRDILLDELPSSDAQLVALSDRLHDLETAVHRATRPERNRP